MGGGGLRMGESMVGAIVMSCVGDDWFSMMTG